MMNVRRLFVLSGLALAGMAAACSQGQPSRPPASPDAAGEGEGAPGVDHRDAGAGEDSRDAGLLPEGGGPPPEARDAPAGPDVPPDQAPAPGDGPPAGPVVVKAFEGAHVFNTSSTNQRRVSREVSFPPEGQDYRSVELEIALRCPQGPCDNYDRRAYLGVVNRPGAPDASVTEIARFVTPYGPPARWTMDVSRLRPLLVGQKTLQLYIDTWVGPGSPLGNGWTVDVTFTFAPGRAERRPLAVLPLWDIGSFEYGDPAKPIAAQVPDRSVTIPPEARGVELVALITGHGQGNADNCAEFCAKQHAFRIGTQTRSRVIWRTDCRTTAVPSPGRNWTTSRAGWCPGAMVSPWVVDVTEAVAPGAPVTVGYQVQAFENTCRPDAMPCRGCTLGTGCMFDSGLHTVPVYVHSALLVVYGP